MIVIIEYISYVAQSTTSLRSTGEAQRVTAHGPAVPRQSCCRRHILHVLCALHCARPLGAPPNIDMAYPSSVHLEPHRPSSRRRHITLQEAMADPVDSPPRALAVEAACQRSNFDYCAMPRAPLRSSTTWTVVVHGAELLQLSAVCGKARARRSAAHDRAAGATRALPPPAKHVASWMRCPARRIRRLAHAPLRLASPRARRMRP